MGGVGLVGGVGLKMTWSGGQGEGERGRGLSMDASVLHTHLGFLGAPDALHTDRGLAAQVLFPFKLGRAEHLLELADDHDEIVTNSKTPMTAYM